MYPGSASGHSQHSQSYTSCQVMSTPRYDPETREKNIELQSQHFKMEDICAETNEHWTRLFVEYFSLALMCFFLVFLCMAVIGAKLIGARSHFWTFYFNVNALSKCLFFAHFVLNAIHGKKTFLLLGA